MRIKLTTVYVDDQDKALRFYTEVLGFMKKADFSQGPYRWLTVGSPDEPDGTELQLALNDDPAAKAYQQAIFTQGQPAVMFFTDDVQADYERIKERGGEFTMPPTDVTGSKIAMLKDALRESRPDHAAGALTQGRGAGGGLSVMRPIAILAALACLTGVKLDAGEGGKPAAKPSVTAKLHRYYGTATGYKKVTADVLTSHGTKSNGCVAFASTAPFATSVSESRSTAKSTVGAFRGSRSARAW